jgi:DNA processing protein
MTDLRENAAVLALVRRGDRPWHHYAGLIDAAGSAQAVLTGEYEVPFYEPPRLFEETTGTPEARLDAIVEEIRAWHAEGLQLVTIVDESYPENLRSIHNRPPFLFVRGHLAPSDARSVAVVGTRNASPRGLQESKRFAAEIADAGFVVVSGLAKGVDAQAHRAALDMGARTVAVIGTGIRRVYPAENASLQNEIAATSAVISQFWPDAPPQKQTFPMRNIVMSGFALATVVIEASNTSGARMQARFALEHGRPVFLHERLLDYEWAQSYAERPGAHVVAHAIEVIATLDRFAALDTLTV